MWTSTDTMIKNDVMTTTLSQYALLHWVPLPGKHTILAGFTLHNPHLGHMQLLAHMWQHALHDLHTEVITWPIALHWLLEEVLARM